MKITEHFTTKEMTKTSTNYDNQPNPAEFSNLYDLCFEILEPIRKLLCDYAKVIVKLDITSGYRSEEVNEAVNGAKNSQHMTGNAADFIPKGIYLTEAYHLIQKSNIPYDQMILENGWIHISHSKKPRRQSFVN